jgi:hypothetical protein
MVLYLYLDMILYKRRLYKKFFRKELFNDELWDHQWYLQDTRTESGLPDISLHVLGNVAAT